MQSYIVRCKHCQREYSTSEDGASMEYCPECQKAIDEALGKIPVKFKPKQMEIVEPMLFPLFDKIKKDDEEERKKNKFAWSAVIGLNGEPFDGYDNIDVFIHNRKKYLVKYNDETPEDRHIYVSMVYDVLNEKFTNQPWRYDSGSKYMHYRNTMKDMMETLQELYTNTIEIDPPIGKLLYMDYPYNWTLHSTAIEDGTNNRKEREHILKTRYHERTGAQIKNDIKYGWHETTVEVADGIDVEKLIDFVDYKYTYQQYDDESVATIIAIEAA